MRIRLSPKRTDVIALPAPPIRDFYQSRPSFFQLLRHFRGEALPRGAALACDPRVFCVPRSGAVTCCWLFVIRGRTGRRLAARLSVMCDQKLKR